MFAVTRPRPTFVRLFAVEKNDDLLHVGDVHEVKVAKSFEASAKGVQAIVDYDNLSDMFYARNIVGAYAQSRIDELVARWNDSIPQLIEDTTLAGAQVGLQQSPGASLGYTFNLVNPRAVAWAREHSSQFLSGVNERSQKAIQAVIAEALSAGMDPREAALLVGQALGLSEKDAAALVKYRKQLEADKNPNVTRMTQRYANRLLRQRGENIARTETMAAANEGARQLWQDLFDRDLLNNNEWERSWLVAPDERVCPTCRPLHKTRADVDGVFEGGYKGPPRHSRCRCTHVLQRRDVPLVVKPVASYPNAAYYDDRDEKIARDLFGSGVTVHDIAAASSAPEEARVRIREAGTGRVYVKWSIEDGPLAGAEGERRFIRQSDGSITLYNRFVELPNSAPAGTGTRLFNRQVRSAAQLGVSRIETVGARGESMNGYYTWPRLGYDGPLGTYAANLPDDLKGAVNVSDLMKTERGRSWWKQHGSDIDLTFDLKPGSHSRNVLDTYSAAKGWSFAEDVGIDDIDEVLLDRIWRDLYPE